MVEKYWEAVNDNPRVFTAFGNTAWEALRNVATALEEADANWLCSVAASFDEDEESYWVTVYV